jgi:hypothetical protein
MNMLFRNVERHEVQTVPGLLAVRVDESLYFANATAVEDRPSMHPVRPLARRPGGRS